MKANELIYKGFKAFYSKQRECWKIVRPDVHRGVFIMDFASKAAAKRGILEIIEANRWSE